MANAKKISIVTESYEVVVIRTRSGPQLSGNCEQCGTEVKMHTLNDAVSQFGTSDLQIFRLVQSGKLHYIETANRHLLICRNSLVDLLNGAKQ